MRLRRSTLCLYLRRPSSPSSRRISCWIVVVATATSRTLLHQLRLNLHPLSTALLLRFPSSDSRRKSSRSIATKAYATTTMTNGPQATIASFASICLSRTSTSNSPRNPWFTSGSAIGPRDGSPNQLERHGRDSCSSNLSSLGLFAQSPGCHLDRRRQHPQLHPITHGKISCPTLGPIHFPSCNGR